MIRRLMLAGADAFRINMSHGDQTAEGEAGRAHPRAGKGIPSADDDPVRPAGAEASRRPFRGRPRRARKGQHASSSISDESAGDNKRVQLPHPELFEAVRPGDQHPDRRRQGSPQGDRGRRRPDRQRGRGRRRGFRQQGRQRPRRARADPGADRQGPRRPAVRARAARGLDRAVLRPAARGRRRGALADRRARGACWPRSKSRRRSIGSTTSSRLPTP